MLSKLLLSAFVSLSFRTANLPDQPTDYEYKGGLKSETSEMSGYRERENGIVYNGFNYNRSSKHNYTAILYKEAQQIDSQSFAIKYPVNDWGIGAGLNSQKWDHGEPMVMIQYKNKIVDIIYEIANSRQIINSKISEEIPLKNNFYLEPLALYHYEIIDDNKKDYWQAKLIFGYRFKTEREEKDVINKR